MNNGKAWHVRKIVNLQAKLIKSPFTSIGNLAKKCFYLKSVTDTFTIS